MKTTTMRKVNRGAQCPDDGVLPALWAVILDIAVVWVAAEPGEDPWWVPSTCMEALWPAITIIDEQAATTIVMNNDDLPILA